MPKLVLGIGGASGAIYAKRLMDKLVALAAQWDEVGVVISPNGVRNWKIEIGDFRRSAYPFDFYESNDFGAPFASGSAQFDTMIICPCSMGTLARIAQGVSNDLMTRAADVMLKERRRLIVVPRETPLSLIHIKNMKILTESGAIICPAVPSFYSKPTSIEELVDTVIYRVLDLADFTVESYRWEGETK
ncbi:MAG: UbiX family flavin prenyltransferase [Saprospiraceae bacterium]|nr:UbiX family flavin prenyltransferase [Saprospiraceae bacterium]